VYRAGIDTKVFYKEMHKWDYEGVKNYSQKQHEKNRAHAVDEQIALGHEYLDNKEKVLYYTVGRESYVVQNKPIKYSVFEKNPLAFYDSILDEEVLMIKASRSKGDADATLNDSMMTERSQALSSKRSSHSPTKKSSNMKRMGTVNMNEKRCKRHIGARVDEVKAAIEEANRIKLEQAGVGGQSNKIFQDGELNESFHSEDLDKVNINEDLPQSPTKKGERSGNSKSPEKRKFTHDEKVQYNEFTKDIEDKCKELQKLTNVEINELKNLNKPPHGVVLLFEACATILGWEFESY
jgi:hypothetical protein